LHSGWSASSAFVCAICYRVLFEDRLSQAISKADREDSPFALMFMDLDGFKAVNDAFGHDVGDKLLVAVTERLQQPLREWRSQGQLDWSMAVNLSALQFEQPTLIETVKDSLARHGIPPAMLILKVTETTAMHNPEQSVKVLTRLTELGVKASIDDPGTGYSSLLYLKRLPACELKIDRTFVKELSGESEDATIVSAIVALARTLNLRVVAEGVETQEQREFLTQLGCNTRQGYLLGKPVTAETIAASNLKARQNKVLQKHSQ